jgi:2-polyprenyl-6-methoxyphenol hydroxylase-like FAD-dependent oxidoreductase
LNDEYSSLVWSAKKSLANELMKLSDEEFVHRINSAYVGEENKNELGTKVERLVQDGFDFFRNSKNDDLF